MTQFSSSTSVITLVGIGLKENEHYIQFVPPATFGVIYNEVNNNIFLIRANGQRKKLRESADKIYALRGFIGLRRRENRTLELSNCKERNDWSIEDDIIRHILIRFGNLERLKEAVCKYCPYG